VQLGRGRDATKVTQENAILRIHDGFEYLPQARRANRLRIIGNNVKSSLKNILLSFFGKLARHCERSDLSAEALAKAEAIHLSPR